MIAVNDVIMVKQFFEQSGNEALMVSFWEVQTIEGDAPEMGQVAEWFHESYGGSLLTTFLHSSAQYVRTVVEFITASLEFGDYSNPINGSVGGEPAPAFVAIDVKQSVGSRLTRNGRKRLPFIGEGLTNGNAVTLSGGAIGALEAAYGLAFEIVDPSDPDNNVLLRPVIVGRTETPPDSGNYVIDPSKVNPVTGADVVKATSQTSRKV